MRKKELTYIVEFEGPDDPLNPLNWSIRKRVVATVLLSLTTFVVTFASSVFSSALRVVAVEFHISDEVATLGTSLFVVGFALGPLVYSNVLQTNDRYGDRCPNSSGGSGRSSSPTQYSGLCRFPSLLPLTFKLSCSVGFSVVSLLRLP
jgi:MFS family permease